MRGSCRRAAHNRMFTEVLTADERSQLFAFTDRAWRGVVDAADAALREAASADETRLEQMYHARRLSRHLEQMNALRTPSDVSSGCELRKNVIQKYVRALEDMLATMHCAPGPPAARACMQRICELESLYHRASTVGALRVFVETKLSVGVDADHSLVWHVRAREEMLSAVLAHVEREKEIIAALKALASSAHASIDYFAFVGDRDAERQKTELMECVAQKVQAIVDERFGSVAEWLRQSST